MSLRKNNVGILVIFFLYIYIYLQIPSTENPSDRTGLRVDKLVSRRRNELAKPVLQERVATHASLNKAGPLSLMTRERTRGPAATTATAVTTVISPDLWRVQSCERLGNNDRVELGGELVE